MRVLPERSVSLALFILTCLIAVGVESVSYAQGISDGMYIDQITNSERATSRDAALSRQKLDDVWNWIGGLLAVLAVTYFLFRRKILPERFEKDEKDEDNKD